MRPRRSSSLLPLVLVLLLALRGRPPGDGGGAATRCEGWSSRSIRSRRSFVVSHDSVPGVMAAMTMAFEVRDRGAGRRRAGHDGGVHAGRGPRGVVCRGHPHSSVHRPSSRIRWPRDVCGCWRTRPAPASPVRDSLEVGQAVPDFTLTDQAAPRRGAVAVPRQGGRDQLRLHQLRAAAVLLPHGQPFRRLATAIQGRGWPASW